MVRDGMNLMEVSIEKDANDNPTCIVWPDGRRFAISSSGAPLMCPSQTAGRFAMSATSMCIGQRQQTHRGRLSRDGG